MSRLAGLVTGKGPGFAPGPIRELSHDSQLSQGLPPEIASPDRREARTFASFASFAKGKGRKTQETSLLFHNNNKEILSLSSARGNEIGEGPPAKVAKVDPAPPSLAPALESEPRRRWLISHAGGEVKSHSFTPPATLAEVRAWYPAALGIEPEEDAPEGQEPAPIEFVDLPDDRITCRQCRHLTGARCQVAQRGGFSFRARWYEPDPAAPHACYLFAPLPYDPDQRAGAARWPSLEWMKCREH